MKRSIVFSTAVVLAYVLLPSPDVALGGLMTNGDFEDGTTPFPNGWTISGTNPASPQTGVNAVGGSGTSALMTNAGGYVYQNFTNTNTIAPNWVLEWDFASQDPGSSGERSMNGSIYRAPGLDTSDIFVTYRVNGDGDFQVYDGSWGTPSGLAGAVIFDDDVTESPLTHHVKFVGHMDLPSPTLDLVVTDSDGTIHSALGLTNWRNGTMGDGLTTLRFDTAGTSSAGIHLIDNVAATAVPEPTSLLMLAFTILGLLGVLRRPGR